MILVIKYKEKGRRQEEDKLVAEKVSLSYEVLEFHWNIDHTVRIIDTVRITGASIADKH